MPIIVDYNPVGLAGTLASQAGMGDASQRNFQMNNAAADDALRRQQFEAQQREQAYENQYRQQEADRNRQMQAAQFGETQRYHDLTTMAKLQDAAARGDRFAQEQLFKYQQEDRRANEFADRQNNADIAAFSKQTDADIKANHADYLAQMKRIDSEIANARAREDARNAWNSITDARGANLTGDQIDALYGLAQTGKASDVMSQGNRWADADRAQMNADRTAEALAPDRARRGNRQSPMTPEQALANKIAEKKAMDATFGPQRQIESDRKLMENPNANLDTAVQIARKYMGGKDWTPTSNWGFGNTDEEDKKAFVNEALKKIYAMKPADMYGQPAPQAAPKATAINPQTGQRIGLVNGQWVPIQ